MLVCHPLHPHPREIRCVYSRLKSPSLTLSQMGTQSDGKKRDGECLSCFIQFHYSIWGAVSLLTLLCQHSTHAAALWWPKHDISAEVWVRRGRQCLIRRWRKPFTMHSSGSLAKFRADLLQHWVWNSRKLSGCPNSKDLLWLFSAYEICPFSQQ